MKTTITLLVGAALSFAAAPPKTFTGVITDAMCGKDHSMMGIKPDAKCVADCVKQGSKYALAVGDNVYELSDQKMPAKFAGAESKSHRYAQRQHPPSTVHHRGQVERKRRFPPRCLMAGPMIQVENLTKTFRDKGRGERNVVDGISFEVRDGEIFGLLGPNGAGKTTTLRMLATLLKPTSGRAMVGGHEVTAEPAAVRRDHRFPFGRHGPLPSFDAARNPARLRHG